MEENARRDPERAEDSGEESNRAILPLLQQPGNQLSHRITNFYIDNILRPDFGRKRKDGTLIREGDSLGVIIRREELTGRRAPKTVNPPQGGEGEEDEDDSAASDDQDDARKTELIDGDVSVRGRGDDGDRCSSPQASSASSGKQMLWPAWVYCTRYSDRPSSGWLKYIPLTLFVHFRKKDKRSPVGITEEERAENQKPPVLSHTGKTDDRKKYKTLGA